ncbi:hypothetical protein ACET98_19410 [Aeromonas veronii]
MAQANLDVSSPISIDVKAGKIGALSHGLAGVVFLAGPRWPALAVIVEEKDGRTGKQAHHCIESTQGRACSGYLAGLFFSSGRPPVLVGYLDRVSMGLGRLDNYQLAQAVSPPQLREKRDG